MFSSWGDDSTDSEDDYSPFPIPVQDYHEPIIEKTTPPAKPVVTKPASRKTLPQERPKRLNDLPRPSTRHSSRSSYSLTNRASLDEIHPNLCPPGTEPYNMLLLGPSTLREVKDFLLGQFIQAEHFLPQAKLQGGNTWLLTFSTWRIMAQVYAYLPTADMMDYSLTVQSQDNLKTLDNYFNASRSNKSSTAPVGSTQRNQSSTRSVSTNAMGSGTAIQSGATSNTAPVTATNTTAPAASRDSFPQFDDGKTIVLTTDNPFGNVRSREEILRERRKKEEEERALQQQQQQQQSKQAISNDRTKSSFTRKGGNKRDTPSNKFIRSGFLEALNFRQQDEDNKDGDNTPVSATVVSSATVPSSDRRPPRHNKGRGNGRSKDGAFTPHKKVTIVTPQGDDDDDDDHIHANTNDDDVSVVITSSSRNTPSKRPPESPFGYRSFGRGARRMTPSSRGVGLTTSSHSVEDSSPDKGHSTPVTSIPISFTTVPSLTSASASNNTSSTSSSSRDIDTTSPSIVVAKVLQVDSIPSGNDKSNATPVTASTSSLQSRSSSPPHNTTSSRRNRQSRNTSPPNKDKKPPRQHQHHSRRSSKIQHNNNVDGMDEIDLKFHQLTLEEQRQQQLAATTSLSAAGSGSSTSSGSSDRNSNRISHAYNQNPFHLLNDEGSEVE